MKLSEARIVFPRIRDVMMSVTSYDLKALEQLLKTRYSSSEACIMLGNHHFKHFLRIHNRRKSHKLAYIRKLGYPIYQTTDYTQWADGLLWCTENLEKGAFISTPTEIIFAKQSDYLEFLRIIG